MIDTDKYEPTGIEILLQNTRAHSPDGWRELSKSLIELSDDDRLLIANASRLRAEVLRLRKEYMELKYAIVGQSIAPATGEQTIDRCANLTHEELIEEVLGYSPWR